MNPRTRVFICVSLLAIAWFTWVDSRSWTLRVAFDATGEPVAAEHLTTLETMLGIDRPSVLRSGELWLSPVLAGLGLAIVVLPWVRARRSTALRQTSVTGRR